jgi:hypothetical protein
MGADTQTEPRTPTQYKVFAVGDDLPIPVGEFEGFSQGDVKKAAATALLEKDDTRDERTAGVAAAFKKSGKVTLAAVASNGWKPEEILFEQPKPRIRLN